MTNIDIFSGFLGAGKTTLIKKLIKEAYAGEKVVLIENEFGEIGVGKLSDVIKAVADCDLDEVLLNAFCTVVDAGKCKMYMKNFGEFFGDQVENASCVILSHTSKLSEEKLAQAVSLIKEKNPTANIVTADWDSLDGKTILAAMEKRDSLEAELERLAAEFVRHSQEHHHEEEHHHKHHHGECDDPNCCCHHDHEHHHEEHHHEHHHSECDDPDCCCHHDHEHHHGHHHHHHADDVFVSWGLETTKKFSKEELANALAELDNEEKYGVVLRAKGIVEGEGAWLHFDYVPEEADVREGTAGVTGRLCVIGCQLNKQALKELFKA